MGIVGEEKYMLPPFKEFFLILYCNIDGSLLDCTIFDVIVSLFGIRRKEIFREKHINLSSKTSLSLSLS